MRIGGRALGRVVAALPWLFGVSCAADPKLPADQSAGPPAIERPDPRLGISGWRRADVGLVSILSDAEDPVLTRIVEKLARFVEVLERTRTGPPIGGERPVRLLLFGRQTQFATVTSPHLAGLTSPRNDRITVALGIEYAHIRTWVAFHEITHAYLLREMGIEYPAWYHEGLAEFLGGTLIRDDVAVLGAKPEHRIQTLFANDALPLERIVSTWHPGWLRPELIDRFYADSWVFVDYLMTARPGGASRHRQAMEYMARVGRGEAWRSALESAFGMRLEALDRAYQTHRARILEADARQTRIVELGAAPLALVFEPVPSIQVAREIARYMVDVGAPQRDYSRRLLDFVLAREPDDPVALQARAEWELADQQPERAAPLIARLSEGAIGAVETHRLRAALEIARHERAHGDARHEAACEHLERARGELSAALAIEPERTELQSLLGHLHALDQRIDPQAGIDVLSAVDGRRPGDPSVRFDLAELLGRAGRSDDARRYLDSVLEVVDEGDLARRARRLRKRLEAPAPEPQTNSPRAGSSLAQGS